MKTKQKLFYLDFIRVLSMIMIVSYHFYAHFAENNIIGVNILFSNGKWGLIGVALFFMISGGSLMYNYEEKIDIKKYAMKRFVGIYPMFWLAYATLFIYLFYEAKGVITALPPYKLIISFFAMDGYLSCYTPTIYLIGEWFLGCIVLIYVLFPFLRKLVKKYPKATLIIATILNLVVLIFYINGIMPINQNLLVSAYSFLLGMYVIKIKQFKWWQAGLGLILAVIFYKLPAANLNEQMLFANIVAYSLYVTLAYLGQKLTNITIQKTLAIISKYSYAVFLVHHYLIMKILSTFQNRTYSISGTILLYATCWGTIIIFAKFLYMANESILKVFKKEPSNMSKTE